MRALIGAGVAIAYLAAAQLGFSLAFVAEQVTTVWPPSGIAIATLLLGGRRLWPAIWIGAFAANATSEAPLWSAAVIATGNTLEALAAVSLLRARPRFSAALNRVNDVLAFLIVAVLACPAIGASVGAVTLCAAGVQPWNQFGSLWWNWWFGDALGAVMVAPPILISAAHAWPPRALPRAILFVLAAAVVTYLAFGWMPWSGHPIEYIVFPIVVAAAVSGGPAITSLVVLSAASVAIWHTVRGAGPFSNAAVHENLILLQLFMGVLGATALLLAAAVDERRASEAREREAAAAVRQREEMLRLAQRAGGVATFEWDFARQTAQCSAEFFAIFGLPARPGVMTGAEWAQYVHPDDREPMAAHLARAVTGEVPAAADYRIRTADGQTRWLSYAGQLQRTPGGDRLLGIVVDITQRKALESELRQRAEEVERIAHDNARLYGEAKKANQLKDEFLATLSHELRTPLNAVLGWSRLLRLGRVEPQMQGRAFESIERNAVAQAQLVDDLLDVSRIVAGKLRVRTGAVDLVTVLSDAVDTVRAGVSAKRLTLELHVPDGPPVMVTGDGDRLQQVFWNVVSNAVKFTPEGGRVDVTLQRRNSKAEIVVRDTGQGIDPAFVPHVFEPFRQMDASKTRVHGGLGLGLSIVKHLVEAHGGTVSAESEGIGRGATFRVQLPIRSPRL